MNGVSALREMPGGQSVVDWFGGVSHFHDANLMDIRLSSQGPSPLRIHAWVMTDVVDDQGYFILDKHVLVTITLDGVTRVALTDFDLPGLIGDLEINRLEEGDDVSWAGSYRVAAR